jgi:hypothetical protein
MGQRPAPHRAVDGVDRHAQQRGGLADRHLIRDRGRRRGVDRAPAVPPRADGERVGPA